MTVPLPLLGAMVADVGEWTYPSLCAGGMGVCRLRVWDAAEMIGHIAVVTELDSNPGASVTNSAECIIPALAGMFPGPLITYEHYPADPLSALAWKKTGRIDWVYLTRGHAEWKPVWPINADHPDWQSHALWMDVYGCQILDPHATKTKEDTRDD